MSFSSRSNVPRPQFNSVRGVDEFGNDSHLVALLAHRAFQKRAHTQFLADRLGFLFPVFETKRRTATDDLEVFDLAQSCDQFFRQSIGKIFVLRITAFVKQWQYRDRFLRGRCSRLGPSRTASCRGVAFPAV